MFWIDSLQLKLFYLKLLKGKLYRCEGDDISYVLNKTECLTNPNNRWVNSVYNHDNIFSSLMTLFVVTIANGWTNIMYDGVDAVGVDMQLQKNHNKYMALYYIFYLMLIGMFMTNMFVGVVVNSFQENRARQLEELAKNKLNNNESLESSLKLT